MQHNEFSLTMRLPKRLMVYVTQRGAVYSSCTLDQHKTCSCVGAHQLVSSSEVSEAPSSKPVPEAVNDSVNNDGDEDTSQPGNKSDGATTGSEDHQDKEVNTPDSKETNNVEDDESHEFLLFLGGSLLEGVEASVADKAPESLKGNPAEGVNNDRTFKGTTGNEGHDSIIDGTDTRQDKEPLVNNEFPVALEGFIDLVELTRATTTGGTESIGRDVVTGHFDWRGDTF
mmetsp:Transcript_16349/g.14048  ORF Transcript_16349/g.14048 Transcript_16349/m.14048 type:complete len:228 (+) Transcript_16349:141-824(+)